MKAVFGKVLLSIFLILIIVLSSMVTLFFNQPIGLQNQNNSLHSQNSFLRNQTETLQTQNNNLEKQINELQKNITDLQNQISTLQNQSNILSNENNQLKDQLNQIQNQTTQNQTQNLIQNQNQVNQTSNNTIKKVEVVINNFTGHAPVSLVFSVSEFYCSFTVKNTGNVAIRNITLETVLTLSDGEKPNRISSSSIDVLEVDESKQMSASAEVANVVVNLYSVRQSWHFVLKTPEGILAQKSFYY